MLKSPALRTLLSTISHTNFPQNSDIKNICPIHFTRNRKFHR